MAQQVQVMKSFLFKHLYRHPQVMETTTHAQVVVRELFDAYLSSPQEMSSDFSAREETPRAVADYIAGMTDRYAAKEHERLTGRRLLA
jgi:dGTPase